MDFMKYFISFLLNSSLLMRRERYQYKNLIFILEKKRHNKERNACISCNRFKSYMPSLLKENINKLEDLIFTS